MEVQKLTRAEEELMQVLWQLNGGFLKEIMEAFPEPRPSQSTVSTVLRILKEKGFVDHEAFGKSFRYYPLISRDDYAREFMGSVVQRFFGGSYKRMLSFFIDQDDIDISTLDELIQEKEDEHE